MAVELKKQTIETEAIVRPLAAQLNLQADAMISGAGRDALDILMEDASATISSTEVQGGRVSVTGVVVCQAAYRQGDIIRAAEARVPLQYSFEDESIIAGMNACVDASVTHVESGYLNGRILFRATVELRGVVSRISAAEVITEIGGMQGVEADTCCVNSVRYGAEAVAQISVSETLALPQELGTQATLMDFGTVVIEKAERDLGGVTVNGRVNAEVMISGGIPGRPVAMVKYPLAFRHLVEMPEWLTENVQTTASLNSIRSALVETGAGEIGLQLDADVTLHVRAVQRQSATCIANAYAVGASDIETEQQHLQYLTDVRSEVFEETVRGTLLIPESMPQVGNVLAAHARPAAVTVSAENGSGIIEGVLEIAVMYMPGDGEHPLTVRDELPFRLNASKPLSTDSQLVAEAFSCEASALMTDRIEIRCGLRLHACTRQAASVHAVSGVRIIEPANRKSGIVMYWPCKDDTLWSIGRRYRIPVSDVLRENNGSDNIQPGKALILRT